MLKQIHVKNMAVIRDETIEFGPGLNIITGETGAGKSVLLGSVEMALGEKTGKNLIRQGAEFALAELTFELSDSVGDRKIREELACEDIYPEDDMVVLSRKVMQNRSSCRINGELVSASVLMQTASHFMDIHGQSDQMILLKKKNHMELLDSYGGSELLTARKEVEKAFHAYSELKKELENAEMDAVTREHTMAILQHEIREIEEADVKPGEDNILEAEYEKLRNSHRITDGCGEAAELLIGDGGVLELLGKSISALDKAAVYDPELQEILRELKDGEAVLDSAGRDLERFADHFEFDPETFGKLEERLDILNHLKSRYGGTLDNVLSYHEEQIQELEKLENYEFYLSELKRKKSDAEMLLKDKGKILSEYRKNAADQMEKEVSYHLSELNFPAVVFRIELTPSEIRRDGAEEVEFMVSLNPGEPVRPLVEAASGGERSRIMLAIRTALAGRDQVPTLIFDEIDTGISGRTAQKVAVKMKEISQSRQVLAVTHLAQIAAMADHHYMIEKTVADEDVSTHIHEVSGMDSVRELARILGGSEITETVLKNAEEMKEMARK